MIEELCRNPHMRRMASFAKSECQTHGLLTVLIYCLVGMFYTYFPDLFKEYVETLGALYDSDDTLRWVFEGGVWPAISINFPPDSFSRMHTDAGNKANGLCPIFSLGDFDPTKGGHLVLPDLKLIIEFPPGCLIFIPSATLRHGNIPVQQTETRTSWTQYSAGGLFRWMQYGGRSWETLKKQDAKRAAQEMQTRKSRWAEAIKAFPTVASLRTRAGLPA